MWCLCTNLNCFIAWLDKWQTLISGVLAVAAATYAAVKLRQQIGLQKLQIDDERSRHDIAEKRKQRAARVAMPDALSAICAYTDEVYSWLIGAAELPLAPEEALRTLKWAVEHLDGSGADAVVDLLVEYQVHRARIEDGGRYMLDGDKLHDCMLLRYRASSLFDFARGTSKSASRSYPSFSEVEDVLQAFQLLIGEVSDQVVEHTRGRFDRRHERESKSAQNVHCG